MTTKYALTAGSWNADEYSLRSEGYETDIRLIYRRGLGDDIAARLIDGHLEKIDLGQWAGMIATNISDATPIGFDGPVGLDLETCLSLGEENSHWNDLRDDRILQIRTETGGTLTRASALLIAETTIHRPAAERLIRAFFETLRELRPKARGFIFGQGPFFATQKNTGEDHRDANDWLMWFWTIIADYGGLLTPSWYLWAPGDDPDKPHDWTSDDEARGIHPPVIQQSFDECHRIRQIIGANEGRGEASPVKIVPFVSITYRARCDVAEIIANNDPKQWIRYRTAFEMMDGSVLWMSTLEEPTPATPRPIASAEYWKTFTHGLGSLRIPE